LLIKKATKVRQNRFNDYYHKKQGIILEDCMMKNVFLDFEGNLLFVDPVIFLETPDLCLDGKSQFHFPFGQTFSS
jgi:hypothetical protein